MAGSAISTPTAQLVNANVQNDGSADSPRGYAISANADLTMTIANTRVYVTATSANRTVTLPTTSVKAGMVVEVQTACTSPYTIAINSSGANLIDTLKGTKGSIKLMALQDAPTTAAHWRVTDVYDEGTWTPVITAGAGAITSYTSSGLFSRINKVVQLNFQIIVTNNGTGASYISITGMPFLTESSGMASGSSRSASFGGHEVSMMFENTNLIVARKYDGTYPFGTNSTCNCSINYLVP